MMTVSVAMAAYNGMGYIEEQINSILPQLETEDELIISVDPSLDGTMEFLEAWAKKEPRIRLFTGPGKGLLANFEQALTKTTGDIIFLADQDDVWLQDKVASVKDIFEQENPLLVLHDAIIVDGNKKEIGSSFFSWRGSKLGYAANLIKNSYIGCCMAFRRELKDMALPLPKTIPMHDQWLGLLAEKRHGAVLLQKKLLLYRRHENNVSADSHSSMGQMFRWRYSIWKALKRREKECR